MSPVFYSCIISHKVDMESNPVLIIQIESCTKRIATKSHDDGSLCYNIFDQLSVVLFPFLT